jgi:hypothetical protein
LQKNEITCNTAFRGIGINHFSKMVAMKKKKYTKVKPIISRGEFINRALAVQEFVSSSGKRYQVLGFQNDEMHFRRLDANRSRVWSMNLTNIYYAYTDLDDFKTINFKQYVPITHSPARGLLIHFGMIELTNH